MLALLPEIDVALVVYAGVTLVCAIALLVNWFENRAIRGVLDFARALALQSAGALIDGVAIAIGSVALDALGNALIFLGNAMLWLGLRRFFAREGPSMMSLAIATIAYTGLFIWRADVVAHGAEGKVVLTSFGLACGTALSASELLRRDGAGRAVRLFMAGVVTLLTALLCTRGVLYLVTDAAGAHGYDKVFHTLITFIIVALVLGAVMLTTARLQAELKQQAAIDPLTGVFNRRAFFEAARATVARAERTKTPAVVIILDLDHFKRINDTHGHGAGDVVLQHVTRVMQRTLRGNDIVARFGGEEFVALLPDATEEAGLEVAERVRKAIADTPATAALGVVTTSIGLSALREQPLDLEGALRRADAALYAAKAQGRDRVVRAA